MSNTDNLIPLNKRTKEEQRAIAQKGGKASGKARRRKRSMKEAAQLVLYAPVSADKAEILKQYGVAESDCTNLMLIIVKAMQLAADGDMRATIFLRDTLGENPQYTLNEKRLELLIADKTATQNLIDDWVTAVFNADEERKNKKG